MSTKLFWRLCCLSLLTLCLGGGRIVEWDLEMAPLMSTTAVNEDSFKFLKPDAHSGGYFTIDGTDGGHMFYMYIKNRHDDPDAPLLFWTNGGPGCSSLIGLFLENGPYRILDDLTLCWNPHGWDTAYNIIFVDHPLDVGFSYGSEDDKVTTEEQVAEHILQFFYAFYEEHRDEKQKPLFLAGESYAGHYLPPIANRILDANEKGDEMHIPLKAMAIGNPWTNPSLQYRSYPVYGYEMKLIDEETKNNLLEHWQMCNLILALCSALKDFAEMKSCYAGDAFNLCSKGLYSPVVDAKPHIDVYDVRRTCSDDDDCHDMKKLERFMNLPQMKKRFQIPEDKKYMHCNTSVYDSFRWDKETDMTPSVARLLDKGLPILIYAGDQDLICNYIGVRDWIEAMKWTSAAEWKQAAKEIWKVNGEQAGEVQTYDLLTFLKIEQCGHLAARDKPEVSLEMITTFTDSEKTWTASPDQRVYMKV